MKKERMTTVSLEEAKTMEDRTRKDTQVGPSLPEGFWNHAKMMYPEEPKESAKIRYARDRE